MNINTKCNPTLLRLLFIRLFSCILLFAITNTNCKAQTLLNTEDRAKTVNSILLDMAFMGTTSLTPQQLSTLQGIAAECPYTEGTAVYDARVLVAPYDTTDYLNVCETEFNFENNGRYSGSDSEKNVDSEKKTSVRIYPNPAQEIVTVELNDNNHFNLYMFNILGEQVKNYTGVNTIRINVQDLPNGIYILMGNTEQNVFYENIVINR